MLVVASGSAVRTSGVRPSHRDSEGRLQGHGRELRSSAPTSNGCNTDNGRKYNLKTNKKGEYFSLGIEPGKYKVTLTQDGKQLDQVSGFPVGADEADLDFDLKKVPGRSRRSRRASIPEQLKPMQEQQAKAAKETNTVKALNEKLAIANQAMQSGDFETAVTTLNEATQMDPTRDLLWARLGDANLGAGPQADRHGGEGEALHRRRHRLPESDRTQKANMAAAPKPDDPKNLAAYYNNLGQAEARIGSTR